MCNTCTMYYRAGDSHNTGKREQVLIRVPWPVWDQGWSLCTLLLWKQYHQSTPSKCLYNNTCTKMKTWNNRKFLTDQEIWTKIEITTQIMLSMASTQFPSHFYFLTSRYSFYKFFSKIYNKPLHLFQYN
jgi:hypothetical protein